MATQYASSAVAASGTAVSAGKRYLHGPIIDFLCFGGATLILLPLLALPPAPAYQAKVALVATILSYFINYPHFAHSYQIFYRGFRRKAAGGALGRELQTRYVVAGLVVPALSIGFFGWCIATDNLRALGYCGNAMALFVGWHYAKQGYGLLMVDCSLKRQFFNAGEKKILLVNSYAVWALAWELANLVAAKTDLFGIAYYSLPLPAPAVQATAAVVLATSTAVAWVMARRWRGDRALPVNGVVAYVVSLYVWLLAGLANPLWLLVIPALHSLQYLAVVWRFQASYEGEHLTSADYKRGSLVRRICGDSAGRHLALFVVGGILLGAFGFKVGPVLLSALVPYNQAVFGGGVLFFTAWIFINVHHYFMDNVMWRRDNPDVKRYLFS